MFAIGIEELDGNPTISVGDRVKCEGCGNPVIVRESQTFHRSGFRNGEWFSEECNEPSGMFFTTCDKCGGSHLVALNRKALSPDIHPLDPEKDGMTK
jgi:hypothetical protein